MARGKYDQFLQHRQSLLIQYRMGDLTKHEFIMESYHYLEKLGIRPFERIDNIKKAIYNYHYFNVRAKYWQRLASSTSIGESERQEYHRAADEEYRQKDHATIRLLRLIDYKGVEAYPVIVHSKKLKGNIVEIILSDPDTLLEICSAQPMDAAVDGGGLILHTLSTRITNVLRDNGVFFEQKRRSLTENYINSQE